MFKRLILDTNYSTGVGESMEGEGKLELGVVTEKQDAQSIYDAIKEAETELGFSSNAKIEEEPRDRSISGMNAFLLVIATAFATSFAKKFGESFAD